MPARRQSPRGASKESPSNKAARTAPPSDGIRRIAVVGGSQVLVGTGLFAHVPEEIAKALAADGFKASKYVIVSDETVWGLYGAKLVAAFEATGVSPLHYAVKPGEKSKDRRVMDAIHDYMLRQCCVRDTCVIALGGGVVGDLAGFVAATFMRGVPVFQVPTSMMAMVDSSVGGKTAVNVPAGKNLVGAFHQPRRVFVDTDLLKSLGRREIAEGLAEVVKMGVIRCAPLFEALEADPVAILRLESSMLAHVVGEAIRLKAEVVALDEKEQGVRSTLNFGHTVGHAIEALKSPQMLHGECVAIGMAVEAYLARDLGELTTAAVGRIVRCLQAFGLPTALPPGLTVPALLDKMKLDKKNAAGAVRCTIVTGIGSSHDDPQPVALSHLERLLAPALAVVPPPYGSPRVRIRVPGSKSISNRVLLMAALGEGPCRLRGLLHSDDTHVMLSSLQLISECSFTWEEGGDVLRVDGCAGRLRPSAKPLYLGNAGTASRFLTTTCALIDAPGAPDTVLTGDPRMKERPIGDLTEALGKIGCEIEHLESAGSLPIAVKAKGLAGGEITLSGKVSSQFVSSVLLSAPYAQAPVILRVPEAVSQQYIEMTLQLMGQFGVAVQRVGNSEYRVPRGCYRNPPAVDVEADASSATYPLAIAALTGGKVTCDAIGSSSCQGDAQFHTLCKAMGCTVSQSDGETTVGGPPAGTRLRPFELDMESMTDAFMTAAVLAAVADGISTITGIANQRVKECNRIEAMIAELAKLGVRCEELADGLRIHGRDPRELAPAQIHCYRDHRIAMSFASLGCAVPGITLLDTACVDKTYPDFWSHLANVFKFELRAAPDVKTGAAGHHAPPAGAAEVGPWAEGATLVLVGMRGSGKTALGRCAARELGREHVDLDESFEAAHGPVAAFVQARGWPAFREAERALLAEALRARPLGAVLSCGGGVVELEGSRALLRAHRPVVHVAKAEADMLRALDGEGATIRRPSYGEPTCAVLARRAPLYAEVADFEFAIREGDADWAAVSGDFARLARRVSRELPPPAPRPGSFFLSLTQPSADEIAALLPALAQGVDALELRADLLAGLTPASLRAAIATLRRASGCALIVTVRGAAEGGQFRGDEAEYVRLCAAAASAAVEMIDLEVSRPAETLEAVLALPAVAAGVTAVIGSHHDFGRAPSAIAADDERGLDGLLARCGLGGKAAIAKLVLKGETASDSLAMRALADRALPELRKSRADAAVIAICVGDHGKLSRVLNEVMTPVTHPRLTAKAAPGQLSAAELVSLRTAQGLELATLRFAILGSPVGKSPSPDMHNAAFAAHILPHEYVALEMSDMAAAGAQLLDLPTFGGASVTIPLKEAALKSCHELSPAAARIGAVNTLIPLPGGRIRGDNTDWLGIRACLSPHLRARGADAEHAGAIVLGAGGTARAALYALRAMGVSPLFAWNRTASKAAALASEFGAEPVTDLSTFAPASLALVVGTTPGSAGVTLPSALLAQHKPAVLDAAYIPRMTPLLTDALAAGCELAFGAEMLFEQGCAQFELWTGRVPPRKAMATAIAARIAEPNVPLPPALRRTMEADF